MIKWTFFRFIVTLLVCVFMLTGCGGGTNHSNSDDNESVKNKKEAYLWSIKYSGTKYDLGSGITELVKKTTENGKYIIFSGEILEVKDDVVGFSGKYITELNAETKDMWSCSLDGDEHTQAMYILFDKKANLSELLSAEGLGAASKEKDLPDYYVNLHYDGNRYNYWTVVVEGKVLNLSNYLNDLPDKLTDEYQRKEEDKWKKDLADKDWTRGTLPSLMYESSDMEVRKKMYNEEEGYRNGYAILNALCDAVEDYQNGDVNSFGTISYCFENGEMERCIYIIYSESEPFRGYE